MGVCQTEKYNINSVISREQTYKRKASEKLKKFKIDHSNYNSENKSSLDSSSINNVQFNNTKRKVRSYKVKKIKNFSKNSSQQKSKNSIKRSLNEKLLNDSNYFSNITIKSSIKKISTPRNMRIEEKIPIDNKRKKIQMTLSEENQLNKNNQNKSLNSKILNTSHIKSPSLMIVKPENTSINKKIIHDDDEIDDDDTDTIIYIDEEINKKTKKANNNLILSFDGEQKMEDIQLYHLNEFNFNSQNKFSDEKDFDNLLQSEIHKNKVNFTNLLLNLPERRWYKEVIDLSDLIKINRKKKKNSNLSSLFYENLNKFIKIYEHFNHLVWALGFFYSQSLLYNKSSSFKKDKINLPIHNSLEWIKGFEWKGLHIRVLTHKQAKKLIHEIKALKYILFDYLNLFNNNSDVDANVDNLLSNEIIFPFMSYAYVGGIYLYVSVEIKKLFYDENSNYLTSNVETNLDLEKTRKSLIRQSLRLSIKYDNYDYNFDDEYDDISFDDNDDNILNKEINLESYSKNDLDNTKILHKISENNLLKIFDDYNGNKIKKKFKFILINIYSLLPNLFKEDDKTIYHKFNQLNCIDIKNEFESPRFINLTKVNNLNKNNEMITISKLIRTNATNENVGIYKNRINNIDYKIIHDNSKKGNKINELVTKFFVQFPLMQNAELSRLLVTEYLNVGNLNIILNKYNTENTQEIPDRNIIIYRTSFQVKRKYSIIDNTKEQSFPKNTEEYISYFKQVCKEMTNNAYRIRNIDNLFEFCEKFGLNKKFLPFCLEFIEDEYLLNLIQIYLYVSFIKSFYEYHEGETLLMKLAIFERNKDESIINSSDFIKDNNIIKMQKKFILDIIKLVFLPVESLKDSEVKDPFIKNFFQNISFFLFLKILKIRNFDKFINFKSNLSQLEIKQILITFNELSRKNPFLFIDTLEKMINFRMNPFLKYRASIDINNLKTLNEEHITIFTPKVESFVDVGLITSYIFTDFAQNVPPPPSKNNIDKNNNKINQILSKIELDYFYPGLIFKSPLNYVNGKNNKKILLVKPIHYYIYSEEIMKKYIKILEQILEGNVFHNGKKELLLFKEYLYLILSSIFCNTNNSDTKNIIQKMKEIINYQYCFSFTQYSVLYLLEAIISKDDKIISEEFYYKTLILALLNLGDIKSQTCKIHQFLIFPLFQLSKIIGTYNNNYLNEYLNELNIILNKKIYENYENDKKNNKLNLGYYNFPFNYSLNSPNDTRQNKKYFEDNNFKFFICNVIFDYFYSVDNLVFDDDYLIFSKINIKDNLKKEKSNNNANIIRKLKLSESYNFFNKYISDYLLDEISYQKYAPGNIIISFGNNNYNQTAQNDLDDIFTPRIIYSLLNKKIRKIFSGHDYNFAIDEKDRIYSWGFNSDFQCGISNQNIIKIPTEISIKDLEKDEQINNIFCGKNCTYFLSNKNKIYLCGYNLLTEEKYSSPKKINLIFEKENIAQIEIGENCIIFLTKEGNVYFIKEKTKEIKRIETINNIKLISCGYTHYFALDKNNILFGWGSNDRGQLGLNENNANNFIPKKIVMNDDIDNIYCGKDFTIFHTMQKEILACGNNDYGQLGIEKSDVKKNKKECIKPTRVEQFYKLEIIKVVCGENNCIAMVRDSTTKIVNIWSWGNNREGQLGLGNNVEESKPKPIPSLLEYVNHYPKDITCGKNHCLVLLQRNDEINFDQNKIINDLILKYNRF